MRGAMGSGKSTFIERNHLKQYTLCADDIRLLYQTPVLTADGHYSIAFNHDKDVWKLLMHLLEERMKRGEFTIVDATHSKTDDITKYKDLAQQYRYRVTLLDFTDVPIEVSKERNLLRDEHKYVPEHAIENAYERFKSQQPPGFVEVVKPEQYGSVVQYNPRDLSEWKAIHHIGDIHGCHDALMEYFKDGLKDDELYIFVGDYVDRGTKNADVMKFLFDIYDRPNVIMLEGNHEIHLWRWANDEKPFSREFRTYTQPELEQADISKKETRMFYRKLHQVVYYNYKDKKVLVTHGGISRLPKNLTYIATEQFVKGVGEYETEIDRYFFENTDDGIYQVHGHRNIQHFPTQVNDRCFNLDGRVEMGGELRVAILNEEGWTTCNIPNVQVAERFKPKEKRVVNVSTTNEKMLEELRESKQYIVEKPYGAISSFNFSRKAFYGSVWNEQTVKARGLFINTETTEIVARSYNKFFNIGERDETKIENLQATLQFPVIAYEKENGFLGLVGYDSQTDSLFTSSKSSPEGKFADWFRERLYEDLRAAEVNTTLEDDLDGIKEFLRDTNSTLVFECVDPVNDPHIIEYRKPKVVLLDIVYRTPEYRKMDLHEIHAFADRFGLEVKKYGTQLDSWPEFYDFYTKQMNGWNPHLEGYVFEDAVGFMTKLKLPYYAFWKHMRGLRDELTKKQPKVNTAWLYTSRHNQVYAWMRQQNREYLKSLSIIELRREFERSQTATVI